MDSMAAYKEGMKKSNENLLTKPYEYIFCKAIKRIQSGKAIPKFMMDAVMGKDNNSITEMLYPNITSITIKNACEFVYRYNVPKNIKNYKGTVLFWRGSNEQYPKKSVTLLKNICKVNTISSLFNCNDFKIRYAIGDGL